MMSSMSASVMSMGLMPANISSLSFCKVVEMVMISDAEKGMTAVVSGVAAGANETRCFLAVDGKFVRSVLKMAGGGSWSLSRGGSLSTDGRSNLILIPRSL